MIYSYKNIPSAFTKKSCIQKTFDSIILNLSKIIFKTLNFFIRSHSKKEMMITTILRHKVVCAQTNFQAFEFLKIKFFYVH